MLHFEMGNIAKNFGQRKVEKKNVIAVLAQWTRLNISSELPGCAGSMVNINNGISYVCHVVVVN